eukprot:gb/GFBE01053172.1/.p1 GENE.gb/GFBE01053172.1/~~gb/GFBE01053172.1/.p1  ORF type:complete len:155 (+),score=43.46 gb/GFBE01053172.1/:1-465(+)
MDKDIQDLLREFEEKEGVSLGSKNAPEEAEGEGSEAAPKKQLSEAQTKALIGELNQKQREELCHVLKAQSDGQKDIRLSPELARILQRFQRRAGLGAGSHNASEETWPMYLGIVLFFVIAIVFTIIYFQEQAASEEEERYMDEDAYWVHREFGF